MEGLVIEEARKFPLVAQGLDLARKIEGFGYEAYLVGGCVRDLVRWKLGLCGEPDMHDVDIASNMPAEELAKHFKTASNNGEKHGTILVFNGDTPFEVTRFRADGEYTDGRHPDSVSFADTFEEDTRRRDFTMNAMGMTPDCRVVDFHGGVDSIRDGVLATVGDPMERFNEDALRIMRAGRFASRFGMKPDPVTMSACHALSPRLKFISMERVHDELSKCSTPDAFAGMLRFLGDGIGETLSDRINWKLAARAVENWKTVHQVPWDGDMAMAILFYSCAGDAEDEMRRFKCTTDEIGAYKFAKTMFDGYCAGRLDLVDLVDASVNKRWNCFIGLVNAYSGKCAISPENAMMLRGMLKRYPTTKDITASMKEKGYEPGPGFGRTLRSVRLIAYKLMSSGKTMTPDQLDMLL